MNISQLLRGIVGSTQPVDAKALELKIGEIVKGVVLQLLADQEAIVNIGGAPVRARLETPLQVGQMTLMQVQPQSNSSQVVLKPLGSSNVPILETSFPDLLKSFGLKDTEANRAILQQLHAAAIPLNAKTIKMFQPIGNMVPAANIPQEQWTEAAIVAFKKGLPLKGEIVLPLQQVMFGKPLSQSLEQLQSSLQKFIQSAPGQDDGADTMTLVRKLVETISGLSTGRLLATAATPAPAGANTLEQGSRLMESLTPIPQADGKMTSRTLNLDTLLLPAKQGAATAQAGTQASTQSSAQASTQASTQAMPASSVLTPSTQPATASQLAAHSPTTNTAAVVLDAAARAAGHQQLTAQVSERQGVSRPMNELLPQGTIPPAVDMGNDPWIKQLLKQLGVDYEHRTAHVFTQSTATTDMDELQFRHESVKGLLLQLAQSDQLPSALKDTVQQIVQHITGQQLLLGGERGSPFSLVTLFVPIQHQDGTDTASVHIQSKRSQSGNLDADNCRLLFDLRMTTLGDTLVDVQVVDRIVSLQVHNDFPMIGPILESLKPEIESAMTQIGFQFISMKHVPYPDPTAGRTGDNAVATDIRSSISSTYHSKPYKGVDFRV